MIFFFSFFPSESCSCWFITSSPRRVSSLSPSWSNLRIPLAPATHIHTHLENCSHHLPSGTRQYGSLCLTYVVCVNPRYRRGEIGVSLEVSSFNISQLTWGSSVVNPTLGLFPTYHSLCPSHIRFILCYLDSLFIFLLSFSHACFSL